jgi:intraflagellar transport protein 140
MRQYRKNGEITTVAFYTLPLRSEILRKAELKQTYSPPFFFGTSRGSVVYADDLGHCTDLQKLPSSIDIMLFFDEKFRLIIITRSLMLTQYQVADDGKVSRLSQTKLSIMSDSMDKGLKYVVWANPGLLAMASQEKMIRFFDIATEESYNLSLSSLAEIERNDRVVCVAFGALDRYIAAGTQQGVVAIWSYVGPIRDLGSRTNLVSSSPSDWEFQYKINLRSPILQLEWHGGRGTLGVVTEDNSVVLSEVIMQGGLCGDLAVLQRTSTEVSVLIGGVLHSNDENTGMTVKGLSVAHSCFVVWSGKSARVYRVDLSLHSIDALNAFPTNGIDIVIADTTSLVDEALFIAEGRAVKITNFTGKGFLVS